VGSDRVLAKLSFRLDFFWTKNHDFMSKKKTLTSTFLKNHFFLAWKEYSAKTLSEPTIYTLTPTEDR
jgi:hypothetical protein